ncbi:alpha/beta-hydrolase [Clathrospora elynae]|uniref:Alpha/beta-hydrolase n=1 Tax=Clathrospora elynae TaxID=706981 RepID=A0A6A5SP24_9PLEO|nr:alpha/beta-hydrolase [Clathrospora elynae]
MSAQTTSTKYATVKGVKLAYRRFGKPSNIPLIFLTHFRGTMDLVDPLLANSIAASRELILFDNAGVGNSEGTIQDTLQESGATVVDFLASIGVRKADIVGFSMGGMIAQTIAVEHPEVVNKIVLAGTQSSYTEGIIAADPEHMQIVAAGNGPTEDEIIKLFFYPSETSKALGHAWWKRIQERHVDGEERTGFVDQAGSQEMLAAIVRFASDVGFFDRLKLVETPVLVTNGKDDVLTPTANSFILQQRLRDVELHIFPDSGHGHLYQFPEAFAALLELFLG